MLRMLLKKRLSIPAKLLIAVIVSAVLVSVGFIKKVNIPLQRLENRLIDYRFQYRGPAGINPNVPVVIVYLDNDSVMEYGYRSPTPRKLLADLITVLDAHGARLIGVDVLLDMSYNAEEDAILESAFQKADHKVVIVTDIKASGNTFVQQPILPQFARFTHQGFSKSKKEGDDFHRWVNLGTYEDQVHFSVKLFQLYIGREAVFPERLNLKTNPWVLLNFPGPPSRQDDANPNFPVLLASEVLMMGDLGQKLFKDKIVLIGSAIEELGDTFLIPFSTEKNQFKPMFGVEFLAITFRMIFENSFLFELTSGQQIAFTSALFIAAAVGFLFFKPLWAVAYLCVCITAWIGASFFSFVHHSLIMPTGGPLASLILIFIICQGLIHSTEVRQSQFLKNTFQHYLPPQLVEQLVAKQEEVSLGGIKEELTIFFSDLKDFTSTSEQLTPEELMEFLHVYFEEMTQILFGEKGTLDKYIGDAVMAFFGAPAPLNDHATHACRTALLMQQRIAELNQKPIGKWMTVEVRMGINTGPVIVGNSGSKTRFNYTVMGDSVNLASRLEGLNKLFGSHILVSEFTLKNIADHPSGEPWSDFFTRELGRFVVKGKAQPVAVYELIDFTQNATPKQKELKARFEEALQAFYGRNFSKAETMFTAIKAEYNDNASEFLLEQIHHLAILPPSDNWNGEIVLLTK